MNRVNRVNRGLPKALERAAEHSAAPDTVRVVLERLSEERPTDAERLTDGRAVSPLGRALVAIAAASRSLGRLCLADPGALDVLAEAHREVPIDAGEVSALARSKRLEMLRIAALDLLGTSDFENTAAALSRLAGKVLEGAVTLSDRGGGGFAVIGMGKLGGNELNYASDVDVLFVTESSSDEERARRLLDVARTCFRVDANLRPDGRSGPLTRSVDSYAAFWANRAATWELQSLIKSRPVAGDPELGSRFSEAAESQLWGRSYSADELARVRLMKARSEALVKRGGLSGREIKRGPGGIRDVEFSVQLLQLVHGRNDSQIRDRSTLGALSQLSEAGYIATEDATSLSDAYRFLRTVEHRLQLVEEEQTHEVPEPGTARQQLARVLGFRDDARATASAAFDAVLIGRQSEVRSVHERLFFRPLLEAFSELDMRPASEGGIEVGTTGDVRASGSERVETEPRPTMELEAVSERLAAFGFSDVDRTSAAVRELAGGLTRSSRLMEQLLPLLLDWLSMTPDPDLGLLGLRNLVVQPHRRSLMVATFRESPEAARRLCLLLGTSRVLAEWIMHNPELIDSLADDQALAAAGPEALVNEATTRVRQRGGESQRRSQLVRMREDHMVRIAARDLLAVDDVRSTGLGLSRLAESLLEASIEAIESDIPFCVVGMGRLGGAELSYASDLDVLLVFDDLSGTSGAGESGGALRGEEVAEKFGGFVRGPSPAQRVGALDLDLRPEGAQGRLARDLKGYDAYFARWAQTWERQAMLRARVVAGDRELGARFMALTSRFVWDRELTERETREIRRMKARIERERIPAREDPQFHLKLGRGSLSDVEWTVQLLQLQHNIAGTGTMEALDELEAADALGADDAAALRASYRFCERTRNRWYLIGALPGGTSPGDALPSQPHQASRLARSFGTTPAALRDEYRAVTRRARRVVERLFYGIAD